MLRSKVSRRLPPLHALRAFEAAARHLSVKKAAAELAVTPTAVSHHIRVLEDTLGVRLFERHARHIALTAYGRDLYPALREGFDKFADAISRLKAGKLRTVVTLSATVAFTARWLAPRVPAFHRDNPGMDLRLHASDEPVDLRSGIADAAIRYGRGEYEGYAAETLFEDAYAPVCSPRLRLREPRDLAKHTMIHFEWRRRRRENATWDRWLRAARVPELTPKSDLIFTDESQAIQAAIAGHGVALLSLALVSDELARGTLIQPFGPTLRMEGYRYDFVYLPPQKDAAAIAALRAWIRKELPES
ncbi:MAG: transcriptional regulator GcvA [Steroidobacteraceae bacterium]|nr:transcriptional regulator GcvA [Steroidobacteraceae bacterium]